MFNRRNVPRMGIFRFINSVIDGLFPKTVGEYLEEENIENREEFQNISTGDWLSVAAVVLTLSILGVLIAIGLIWIGIYFCRRKTKPTDKYREWAATSISIILFLMVVLMILCIVMAIQSSDSVRNELNHNTITDLIYSFEELDEFFLQSIEDIEYGVLTPVQHAVDDIFQYLDALGENIVYTFTVITDTDISLDELNRYTKSIPDTSTELIEMQRLTTSLIEYERGLNISLSSLKFLIERHLQSCIAIDNLEACHYCLDNIYWLDVNTVYYTLNETALEYAKNITSLAVQMGVANIADTIINPLYDYADSLNAQFADDIIRIKEETLKYQENIKANVSEITQNIQTLNFDEVQGNLAQEEARMQNIGNGIFIYVTCLSVMCLLPITLYILAIPAGNECGSGSAKHASQCMKFGITLSLYLGFIVLVNIAVLFFFGSTAQGMACRHIVTYDESIQKIEEILREDNYSLTGKEFLNSCRNNAPLYDAVNYAENVFNISEEFNLENTQVPEMIDELRNNITINTVNVTLMTENVSTPVYMIHEALNDIKYVEYYNATRRNITVGPLLIYSYFLEDAYRGVTDTDLSQKIYFDWQTLNNIIERFIPPMKRDGFLLRQSTERVEAMSLRPIISSIEQLEQQEDYINENFETITDSVLDSAANQLYNIIDNQARQAIENIESNSECYPVYHALNHMSDTVCVYLLYPFNGIWFAFGVYLVVATISGLLAYPLSRMYLSKAEQFKVHAEEDGVPHHSEHVAGNQVSPENSEVVQVYRTANGEDAIAVGGQQVPEPSVIQTNTKDNKSKIQPSSRRIPGRRKVPPSSKYNSRYGKEFDGIVDGYGGVYTIEGMSGHSQSSIHLQELAVTVPSPVGQWESNIDYNDQPIHQVDF